MEQPTPCLLLDANIVARNVDRVQRRLEGTGVVLRPHMKTAKSIEVARLINGGRTGPITVSTLAEAEYFAESGYKDILYAVSISPEKLDRVAHIQRRWGCKITLVTDSREGARAIVAHAAAQDLKQRALIEIDVDGHRSGVSLKEAPYLIEIGRALHQGGTEMAGVMAHAGESYLLSDPTSLAKAAENERSTSVAAARILREAEIPCPIVSIGSTPTALSLSGLEGITELRAGVFMFMDLYMHGVGVCSLDDIALSVLATVIGHQPTRGWIIVDAGWMALSRDRGTSRQRVDQGYGVVCDLQGRPFPDLIVRDANQEHGIIALRSGSDRSVPTLPLGSRVRILPNHACATGAQHAFYGVIDARSLSVSERWSRYNGW